jgi:hypothetical protein
MIRTRSLWTGLALVSAVLVLNACSTIMPSSRSSDVTINGACEQREEDGYYDFIKLKVNSNVVEQLEWTANPRQGRCQFNLADFTQVKTRPQTDLQSKKDRRCHIYIWENDQYVSVSVLNCKSVCAQNDRILPILLNERTGSCAQNTTR